MSRFAVQAFVAGFPRGFAEGTARYGLLLSHMQPAVVGGFMYTQNVIFGADGSATPEQMQARIGMSAQAFEGKRWREDLAQWEKVDKPKRWPRTARCRTSTRRGCPARSWPSTCSAAATTSRR